MSAVTAILIVYDSSTGHTRAMARRVARGVESVTDCEARVRSVATVGPTSEHQTPAIPESGAPFAELEDLEACDGLILGTPTCFGNMSASLKFFLDCTTPVWFGGRLVGKPAAVFTSTGTLHGGQESTLLSMMQPLLHHGMLITGLPYTLPELSSTSTGGTPYGASHLAGQEGERELDDTEAMLCAALGERVAKIARALNTSDTLTA